VVARCPSGGSGANRNDNPDCWYQTAAIGSVFEMSQQSNFSNRAVVEKAGVLYRPIRHGLTLRDIQTQPSPGLAAGAFSLLAVVGGA